jgi:hypothetical protein
LAASQRIAKVLRELDYPCNADELAEQGDLDGEYRWINRRRKDLERRTPMVGEMVQ